MTNTLGLATDGGGPTSHMAILARAFEIPSVVGLRFLGKQIHTDDTLIVDGTNGYVVVRPNEETIKHYEEMKARIEADRLALIQGTTDGPALTLDGTEIHTLANIELLAETQHSLKAKCQGIGLYRTEFLFMNRSSLPGEDDQYQHRTQAAPPRPPQAGRSLAIQQTRRCERVDARSVERFVAIDVAQPGDDVLVHQHRLHLALTLQQPLPVPMRCAPGLKPCAWPV